MWVRLANLSFAGKIKSPPIGPYHGNMRIFISRLFLGADRPVQGIALKIVRPVAGGRPRPQGGAGGIFVTLRKTLRKGVFFTGKEASSDAPFDWRLEKSVVLISNFEKFRDTSNLNLKARSPFIR